MSYPEPAFLKVEEAARILRISRSAAYELANAYLATDGQTGIPVIRLGRSMRVPKAAIEALARGRGSKSRRDLQLGSRRREPSAPCPVARCER